MINDWKKRIEQSPHFKLLSIMKYRGNKKSGHYKCVRKIDDTYYCFDDDKVTKIEKDLDSRVVGCFNLDWFDSKEKSRVLLIENKSKPPYF